MDMRWLEREELRCVDFFAEDFLDRSLQLVQSAGVGASSWTGIDFQNAQGAISTIIKKILNVPQLTDESVDASTAQWADIKAKVRSSKAVWARHVNLTHTHGGNTRASSPSRPAPDLGGAGGLGSSPIDEPSPFSAGNRTPQAAGAHGVGGRPHASGVSTGLDWISTGLDYLSQGKPPTYLWTWIVNLLLHYSHFPHPPS